ncbi:hypothetical protein PsW64_02605 [Pseudovibrio sp. W64]|uniref:hypothetical protein n=1 Tax=Pseudovibrio TaxID=258255 RepID=UPI0007AE9DDC|nr:hypothetical protein [Pseudovibrio sp. W64]KZK81521.1 hypothetical protein PsW64_02605 [Pseudovibrio sp. W64]
MTDPQNIIHSSLVSIGLGPERLTSAIEGAELFGTDGLLTSMEFVQFISTVIDSVEVDVSEALASIDQHTDAIFTNVQNLGAFLSDCRSSSSEA